MSRILVIDDDRVFAQLITLFLQRNGHSVVFELDGNDGLERFKSERFDVVICDIVMPNREGIETIREIRHLNSQVAIVAISGGLTPVQTPGMDVLDVAQILGADATVKKPFPLPAVSAAIDRALANRETMTRSAAS